ncbi:DnrO protein [Dyella halodurans]|uniref:DnrO protein n=1 Tax=Dyella halodurans TaxID=1920171 RepID=A0ABV9BWZ2_9GAMM|nr:DnrO protein [Dyella halodurans]
MNITPCRLVLIGVLGLSGLVQAQPQNEPAAHANDPHTQLPIAASRWPADAPLRDGMASIHTALQQLRHYEMGHMSERLAMDRISMIEDAAASIFAHCKLPPQQDELLHGMLVHLLAAAQKFKQDPHDVAELAAMREAVAAYPRYFDDPGWTSDSTAHGMGDKP